MKKLSMIFALVVGTLGLAPVNMAHAEEPFIGEMKYFGGNFAPRGWAKCDGQLLAISSNSALFSILGTTFGGDGRSTFGLPDMRGRIPLHAGRGAGLSDRVLGQRIGAEYNILNVTQLPSHNHTYTLRANNGPAIAQSPNGASIAQGSHFTPSAPDKNLNAGSIPASGLTGGNQDFNIVQPSVNVTCIIALFGLYPSRS